MNVEPDKMTGAQVREACRRDEWHGPTAGAALGYVQANLVILPAESAAAFAVFCCLNPAPCPVLETTEPGHVEPQLAEGGDLRTDLPRYRVLRDGEAVDRPYDIRSRWRDDFVAFLIGCSFTFDAALLREVLPVRHIEENRNVPMYRTNIDCASTQESAPFSGPLVVSMRPMTPAQAKRATEVTARTPQIHGGPVHIGDPGEIGILDIATPDYGDAVTVGPGEVCVFWACGVTPMEALLRARLPLAITHEPGHMLVTDLPDSALLDKAFTPILGFGQS